MILVSNLRLAPGFKEEDISAELVKKRLPANAPWELRKLSLDARKKEDIHYTAAVETSFPREKEFLRRNRDKNVTVTEPRMYRFPERGANPLSLRPVIIGAGPAGLFCARALAEAGYAPIMIERGAPVEERKEHVDAFWRGEPLRTESNVQFGEGGAGTFSDGKLNTQVKEKSGRIFQVLTWFVEAGADPSILYWNKPHLGTDTLQRVVRNLREQILSLGGEVRFHTCAQELLLTPDGRVHGILCRESNGNIYELPADTVILAIGHSARDTFAMLHEKGIPMEQKPFAVGLRIEHPQRDINMAQYGTHDALGNGLPVADYKLRAHPADGRSVYSFCMCPGGKVVNASSEASRLAVNGMSYADRGGRNANAALVVPVGTQDFRSEDVLAGMAFQRRLEALAWEHRGGSVPVQTYEDFRRGRASTGTMGDVLPDICGAWAWGNLREVLPEEISGAILKAMPLFGEHLSGFDRPDAIFSGVESRTSSPVRILRDEHKESSVKGLFPCGEGAGYAGGITSAAVDGLRTAEEIIARYSPYIQDR